MEVQLISGKEVSNNSRKRGRKEQRKNKKKLERKKRRTCKRRLQKQGNKYKLNSLIETVSRNRRRKHKLTHLQCHFLRGFRKQGGKNSFLNS